MPKKLELMWVGKEKRPRLEPRVLIEDPTKSHHASVRHGNNDVFDNMLIHGDNLLALKALEQQFAGKVKCIYIDPPYNTGNAFKNYDDGIEHSIWLGLMRERIALLHSMLAKDGSMWINIDDDEGHYLKVVCDEIFGRDNFVSTVIWQKKTSRSNDAKYFSDNHDFILTYARSKANWKLKKISRGGEIPKGYANPDNDPRGLWTSTIMSAKSGSDSLLYKITTPSGKTVIPPKGRFWSCSESTFKQWCNEGIIWFGKKGDSAPRKKTFLSDVQDGLVPLTVWLRTEVGDNQDAKHEVKAFNAEEVFDTPKPEKLIERIISLSTNPGDLVLDSFLGSGTTAAVAHKMGRRWIGIELGDHCYTHCKVRLDKVIDGEQGGISKSVNWQGGGGYRFYELAPTLIKEDAFGQKVINKDYNAEMLAEAVCKLEGFVYAPSETEYFIHGHSTERDFIYVTTNYMKAEHLVALNDLVGGERSLLVCCKGFSKGEAKLPNLTVKKIPKAVLDKCEYGHDDYSLNVKNLPMAQKPLTQGELGL